MKIVAVPKILRERLTDLGAEALVQMIDKIEEHSHKVVLEMAEERFEKRVAQVGAALEAKIAQVESRLETKIAETESRLEIKIANVQSGLETKIAHVESKIEKTRADLIQWMFIFWVGQVGTMSAILFAFFKH